MARLRCDEILPTVFVSRIAIAASGSGGRPSAPSTPDQARTLVGEDRNTRCAKAGACLPRIDKAPTNATAAEPSFRRNGGWYLVLLKGKLRSYFVGNWPPAPAEGRSSAQPGSIAKRPKWDTGAMCKFRFSIGAFGVWRVKMLRTHAQLICPTRDPASEPVPDEGWVAKRPRAAALNERRQPGCTQEWWARRKTRLCPPNTTSLN